MVDAIVSTGKCLTEPFIGFFKVAFGHLISCEDNMESLKDEMLELRTKRDSLQRRLDDAARESKTATEEVKLWMHRADELQGTPGIFLDFLEFLEIYRKQEEEKKNSAMPSLVQKSAVIPMHIPAS